jgi:O-glycosyl hydrolase
MKWVCNFSWAGDPDATRNDGPVSTKNGGTLNPNKYTEYSEWLKSCIQSYKDAGIDLYALSLQNEPLFSEPYNSCTYTTQWYCDLLNNVVPLIKSSYPDIKIFGSENMLEMEGKSTSDDPEVFVTAFNHQEKGTNTIVIINNGSEAKSVSVLGDDLPAVFTIYLTTSGSENCNEAGILNPGPDNHFELPAKSVVTLQAGGNPL